MMQVLSLESSGPSVTITALESLPLATAFCDKIEALVNWDVKPASHVFESSFTNFLMMVTMGSDAETYIRRHYISNVRDLRME